MVFQRRYSARVNSRKALASMSRTSPPSAVTAGGTEAIFCAITCAVRPGDEVILLEPAYDSYAPAVALCGGTALRAQLAFPDYRPDWAQVRALLGPRTRLIVVNSPHNPTGAVFSEADRRELEALTARVEALERRPGPGAG